MKQLLNLGKTLSRGQMKNITGGTTCTWTNVSGHLTVGNCGSDPVTCQATADAICAASDSCLTVDCE